MSIKTYLIFNGNCRAVVEYYSRVFNTEKPQIMLFSDAPQNEQFKISEDVKNLVMHAEIKIKDSTIMFSDATVQNQVTVGNNFSMVYTSNDEKEIRKIFEQLKEGGNVVLELSPSFFSKCYGYVIDKFGIGWQLIHEA